MSLDILIEKIVDKQNPTVVGLDPQLDLIPSFIKKHYFDKYGKTLKAAAKSILKFNKAIIDEIHDLIPAIKPQCAYYEMYGYHGIKTLYKTMEYAKLKGLYVITDGKRNDIGPTMQAYANAYLGETIIEDEVQNAFLGDSLTVNGYLGTDGINPLIDICKKFNKSFFVLVKTSNPSSFEIQDIKTNQKYIYEIIAELCEQWGKNLMGKYNYSGIGAVVGATYPEQLKQLRHKFPNTFFLVPGYGTQGATAENIKGAFDDNGLGAIINSSRSIIYSYINNNYDEKDFSKAARIETINMKSSISELIKTIKLP